MKFTSAIGNFYFNPETPLSHAKLVRDTVTAQILDPKPFQPVLTNSRACQDWMADSGSKVLAGVDFEVDILV